MIKKITAYSGIVSPVVGFITIFITTLIHSDWFSWTGKALSDLGAIGTSYAALYNWGMIIAGFFGIVFVIGLFRYLDHEISQVGCVVFLGGMFFLVLVGWFESGTSPHVMVSWGFFSITALGISTVGLGELFEDRNMGILWLALVFFGSLVAYWASNNYSGAAIPEMVGAAGFAIFSLVNSRRIIS